MLRDWYKKQQSALEAGATSSRSAAATLQTSRMLLHDFEKAGLAFRTAGSGEAYQRQMARITDTEDVFLSYSTSYSNARKRETEAALENLMKERATLANQMGAASFAHFTLQTSTLSTPEAVDGFLQRTIQQASRALKEAPIASGLSPKMELKLKLDDILEDFDHVAQTLFGLRVHRAQLARGETWCDDTIIKLAFQKVDTNATIGSVYLDLSPREGKLPHPGHFNLRSGRRIDNDPSVFSADAVDSFVGASGHVYQLPVVLLSMVIPQKSSFFAKSPMLLSVGQTETLWHEMGHVLHCIFSIEQD